MRRPCVLLRDGPRRASRAGGAAMAMTRQVVVILSRAAVGGGAGAGGDVGRGAMERLGAVTCGHAMPQDGDSALVRAASRGHQDTVELLLDRGADLEAKNTVNFPRVHSLPCLCCASGMRFGVQWTITVLA